MPSPAQRHQAMIAAARLAAAASPAAAGRGRARVAKPAISAGERSAYQQMQAKLGADLRRLSSMQSIEKRIALKRELLPEYQDWIAGVLSVTNDGQAAQDDVFVRLMIWTIDVGDFAAAVPMVAHVLKHKLALPPKFDRTLPTLIVEEIAIAAIDTIGKGETVPVGLLDEVQDLTEHEDMPDQVRAKLHKAIGLSLSQAADDADKAPEGALERGPAGFAMSARRRAAAELKRALELDKNVGAKKDFDRLERLIKKEEKPS